MTVMEGSELLVAFGLAVLVAAVWLFFAVWDWIAAKRKGGIR